MPPEILCPRGVPHSPHLIPALLLRPLQPISPGEPFRELDLSAPTPDLRSPIPTYQSLGGASEQRFSETLPCEDPFSIGRVGWHFPHCPLKPNVSDSACSRPSLALQPVSLPSVSTLCGPRELIHHPHSAPPPSSRTLTNTDTRNPTLEGWEALPHSRIQVGVCAPSTRSRGPVCGL